MYHRGRFEDVLRRSGIDISKSDSGDYVYDSELVWIGWRAALDMTAGSNPAPETAKCQWNRRVHGKDNNHIFFTTEHGVNQWHPHYMFCPECGREIHYG